MSQPTARLCDHTVAHISANTCTTTNTDHTTNRPDTMTTPAMTATNWAAKVMTIRGKGFDNEIFGRHHTSAFTFMGKRFETVAQMAAYTVATAIEDEHMAEEVMSSPTIVEEKYDDMGLAAATNHAPDDAVTVVYAVMVAYIAKFMGDKNLFEELVGTENSVFVDISSNDRFWCVGYDNDTMMRNIPDWGENQLGRVIMTARFMLFGGSRGGSVTDELITDLATEAARVHKLTYAIDWKGFTEELEEELMSKSPALLVEPPAPAS